MLRLLGASGALGRAQQQSVLGTDTVGSQGFKHSVPETVLTDATSTQCEKLFRDVGNALLCRLHIVVISALIVAQYTQLTHQCEACAN